MQLSQPIRINKAISVRVVEVERTIAQTRSVRGILIHEATGMRDC